MASEPGNGLLRGAQATKAEMAAASATSRERVGFDKHVHLRLCFIGQAHSPNAFDARRDGQTARDGFRSPRPDKGHNSRQWSAQNH